MHRPHLLVAIAFVSVAQPLRAQARTDTTVAFRQGEWGAEFIPGTSFTTLGVLRFSTPSRAWVLDGSAAYNHSTASSTTLPEQSANLLVVSGQAGPRWYHAEYERVVRFVGFGVMGSYSTASQSANNGGRSESWSAGAYGELGLQYMFTPHLGLGVRDEVAGSRESDQFKQPGTSSRLTNYHLALQPVQVIGAFYF